MIALTIYSRPGCHLCDELRDLLDDLRPNFDLTLEEVDITQNETLFARYRYDIPVLVKDDTAIARGKVNERELVEKLMACCQKAVGLRPTADGKNHRSR